MDDLPEDKIQECKQLFDLMDFDGSGSITVMELGEIMRKLGVKPSEAELQEMIAEVSQDDSGVIEFPEFLKLFSSKMKDPDIEDDLIEAFKVFDDHNKGLLPTKKLKHVLMSFGDICSEEEAEDIISECLDGQDGDMIDYIKFVDKILRRD